MSAMIQILKIFIFRPQFNKILSSYTILKNQPMKKIALLFSMLFVLGLTSQLKAQDFQSAIGGRIWYPAAVSYKFFISEPAAIELYAGFRGYSGYGGFTFGGQYEHHMDISDIEGFQWY